MQAGDVLAIRDSREFWRRFPVRPGERGNLTLDIRRTLYAETGATIFGERAGQRVCDGHVGDIPPQQLPVRLRIGDTLLLSRDQTAGRDAEHDADGRVLQPARIPCVPPTALDDARIGQTVWFDDGRIGGHIVGVDARGVTVTVTHAAAKGSNLRSQKGINLPETDMEIPAMSEDDLAALDALVHHVDLIGLSFVRYAFDVELLQEHLHRLDACDKGIVLKIETRQAFANLPQLLLTATRSPKVAVMVARGDLAVEIGFRRLAEVQEEILWLCEAAHVPVIWATEVLESMARTGAPSRAEITDAAMAERAECVMLNKGPYIVSAVSMLADVLQRMEAHQYKKRAMLRRLAVSDQLRMPSQAATRDCDGDELEELLSGMTSD
jgi:pyruvate kinase